jgi:hypothetical protein
MAISHQKALTYLSNTFDGIPNVDELLQLVEIEFIRRDAVENSANSELQFYFRKAMIFISILRFPFFEKFVQNFGSLPVLQHNLCHLSVYTDPQL